MKDTLNRYRLGWIRMIHYLDNAATTPVRPEAVQAAVEAMTQGLGQPLVPV